MRRQFLTSATLFAVVATALVPPASGAQSAAEASRDSTRRAQDMGYCRNAEPLPQLTAEIDRQQQRREPPRIRTGAAEPAYAPPPPPPPVMAPPPPMAPPAPMPAPSPSFDSPSPVTVVDSSGAGDAGADAAAESSEVIVTGSRIDSPTRSSVERSGKRRHPGTSPVIMPPPRPQPQPQAGLLTAGEHDDLLNPELYAAYVARSSLGQEVRAVPRVDTMRVVTVKVSDNRGQPVPFADVTVTCSDGNRLTMATQADGTAVFFPGLDRLSERVSVSARKNGDVIAAARPLLVSDQPGAQLVGLTANQAAGAVTKLDLMLVIDTTGSMGDEIRYLQSELRSIVDAIARKHQDIDIRLGLVFYRDEGDDYVTRTVGFTRDIGAGQRELAAEYANGGGDYPEAMDQALIRAVGQQWRDDAVKSLLLVADAPPHDEWFGRTWAAAEAARAKRIHITPVAASGVANKAEYVMRAMAAATQSRYLFLTDDSGIGNPHAPPAIDCYLVTRLDALVRRVIDSQISGRRIEPEDQEVIRSVGKYDAGKCILPPDYRWQG